MKLNVYAILSFLLFTLAAARVRNEAVVISYPDNTPNSVMEKAKSAIIDAGGLITHEFRLIKAFAAEAPAKALKVVEAMDTKYKATVEKDEVVHTQDGHSK